jgi:hypothetical protein
MTMNYPLFFGFRTAIQGKGFVASVVMNGRGLMVEEGADDWWLYGVNPGGVAGGGEDQHLAFSEFRNSYYAILFDIANDVTSYEEFRAEVERFFNETNRHYEKEWLAAVEKVREDKSIKLDWAQRQPTDSTPVNIRVELVQVASPGANELDPKVQVAA